MPICTFCCGGLIGSLSGDWSIRPSNRSRDAFGYDGSRGCRGGVCLMSETWRSHDPAGIRGFYDRDGYYVFRQALSRQAIDGLHAYMEREMYLDPTPLLRHP